MSTRSLQFVDAGQDRWTAAAPQGPVTPAAHLLLGWAQWLDVRDRWPQGMPVGVVFSNDAGVTELVPDLPRLALVALPFPKWTDGRAYSLARTLRVRHRYGGRLRAIGDVIADMSAQLQRTGFDEVVLREGERVETAERMLNLFTAFYQGDVQERAIRFAREPGAGNAA